MKLWGVTGLMGAGKSLALKTIQQRGFAVVDSDQVSRLVVDPATGIGKEGLNAVIEVFGDEILNSQKELDRAKLRARILTSKEDRLRLEEILHQRIVAWIRARALDESQKGGRALFIEGTRLIESGLLPELDGLIVVTAPADLRAERIVSRGGMSLQEAQALTATQDEALMRKHASVIWQNGGTPEELADQVDAFLKELI